MPRVQSDVLGDDLSGDRAQPFVALAVVGVTRKGQADLRDRLDLAGPYQPARLGRHAGSSRFSKNTLVAIAAGAIAA